MKFTTLLLSAITIIGLAQCNTAPEKQAENRPAKKTIERRKPQNEHITYTLDSGKTWFKQHDSTLTDAQKDILMAVNRTDSANLEHISKILVPSDFSGDISYYLPFPVSVPALKDVDKILLFSYPSQSFAAYENGELVYTGPTNMGRKKDPTPEGLYFTNWKAEQTTSTFNDEWDLKWNFNIENKEGIGFHQYALPGYPASHSCLRLREKDAKYLYTWADQWELKGSDDILAKGTPVIVFGSYPFDGEKPWLQLATNPSALAIPASEVESIVSPRLQDIIDAQTKRKDYMASKSK